jgi:hypothetical protein
MDEPLKTTCETLQAKMIELLPAKKWQAEDALWNAAVDALGGDYDKYAEIYTCLQCRQMYHGDYSSNSDPDRDFCGWECEESWLNANPDAEYNGELGEDS